MSKNIVILGSSGGNLYNLGGSNSNNLLEEIIEQSKAANMNVTHIQFITATSSLDNITRNTKAAIYELDSSTNKVINGEYKKLEEINEIARKIDEEIASNIKKGLIDGIILASADPEGVNKNALKAAAEKKLPVVGTGGTSMALANSLGCNIIATSGTTGTTNRTRAISSISHLARYWDIDYTHSSGASSTGEVQGSPFRKVRFRGIMTASLPAFIALAITVALSRIPNFDIMEDIFDILITSLPVVISAIAAKQISELDEVGIVAGVAAGLLSTEGGIVGGLLAGIIAGILAHYIFKKTIEWYFSMTTVNIVTGGFAGLISGIFVYLLIAPLALQLANYIRWVIDTAICFNPIVAGALAGLLIWPAILMGVYHAAILPIILLEIETAGNNFIGAIDVVGLGMVAMGINLANIIFPRTKGREH